MVTNQLYASNMDTHIYPFAHPTLLLFKLFIIRPIYSNGFLRLILPDNINLHKSPNFFPYFWMQKHHWKIPIYQLLLLFFIYLPPQGINLPLILMILFNYIIPVILPAIQNHDILIHFQVGGSLLSRLFLQHICQYIINKT